ncbi:ABC transporter ATP-binding protein [Marinobacterium nitratireducens]|uniref:ABC transporter ATP-binding protein n=1 Tax=Marinobacterium nitratireducens TaxID=518897 RepID=A0A917Z5U4_9GAMM|nr:ABC transporter ATP-binding protein [Marinobacterium nitratireducens]GGO75601.1 ABC transporter ATP-binding protein [Marinobacterium nitratireducens]
MAIEVEGLGFRYGGREALTDIGFRLGQGTFTALLGPNGAGKSTLFALLTRLYALQDGEIRLLGQSIRRHSASVMQHLGVVFQQSTLDLDLTVMQNLEYHGSLHGLSRREIRQRARTELERLQMAERLHERVRNLNGGHRRRVEIARALLHRPAILLLDEATVGLDTRTRADLNAYVRGLCRDLGLCALWATHLIEEIAPEDRVLLLHRGRLRADASALELCRRADCDSLAEAFERLTATPEQAA